MIKKEIRLPDVGKDIDVITLWFQPFNYCPSMRVFLKMVLANEKEARINEFSTESLMKNSDLLCKEGKLFATVKNSSSTT